MAQLVTLIIPTYAKLLKKHDSLVNLLDSLKKLEDKDFRVIILNTTDPPDTVIEDHITKLVNQYKESFPIMTASVLDLWKIHEFMEKKGFEMMKPRINMKVYSNFRNIGLIVAHILKSKLVIMVDDDEVVSDPDFLERVREGIGEKLRNKTIAGKTGYYLYNGGYHLSMKGGARKKLWPSNELINETFEKFIKNPRRYSPSTIALGGIMVFSEKLYSKIPFDPYCKRGEDSNYVVSCKQFGQLFVFDSKLNIKHHPPKKEQHFYLKFRQDIYRFVYERERLESFGNVEIEDLDPYPGFFLRDDLYYRAASVCLNYAARALKNKKKDFYRGHMRNMEILFREAPEYAARNAGRYLRFQKRWRRLMDSLKTSKELYKHFDRF